MDYTLSVSNITDTSADITVSCLGTGSGATMSQPLIHLAGHSTTDKFVYGSAIDPAFQPDDTAWTNTYTITGLTQNKLYDVYLSEFGTPTVYVADSISFTTKATGYDVPKVSTQEQWEDLAARVKAKADASSIPTVNNSTITVTNNGLDKGTFTTNQATAGTVALDYPTITMTTTDPGEGAAISANNFVAVYGGDPIIMDYSTSEINTGAKWVDGSAIYKKTINFGALPNSTTKTVAHDISGLAKVIKMEGYAKNSNNVFQMLPYVPTNSAYLTNVHTDLTNIEIQSIGDLSGYTECYVTLYYTKSS